MRKPQKPKGAPIVKHEDQCHSLQLTPATHKCHSPCANTVRVGPLPHRTTDALLHCVLTSYQTSHLTHLTLRSCESVTDSPITLLASLYPLSLTTIDLYGCENLTDLSLLALANCPNLTSLDLFFVTELSDAGLQALARGCQLLTTLNLTGCDAITIDPSTLFPLLPPPSDSDTDSSSCG